MEKIIQQRVAWIDISKGILIMLVIIHHAPQVCSKILNLNVLDFMDLSKFMYLFYFMPAFFILTGYCTNFEKRFIDFFVQNIKTLIFPSILFSIFIRWLSLLTSNNFDTLQYVNPIIPIILWGGDFWFLSALFLSKMFFFVQLRYLKHSYSYILFSILLAYMGLLVRDLNMPNIWGVRNSLYMTIFLSVGYIMKQYKDKIFSSYISYISFFCFSLSFVLSVIDIELVPYIGKTCNLTFYSLPFGIVMAIMGTVSIMNVSAKIETNYFIEKLGRNTLLIYILHISIMTYIMNLFLPYLEGGKKIICILLMFISIIITSIISLELSVFVNKYCKFLLGKF